MASLDLAGRASLLTTLGSLAAGPIEAIVVVLHRLEDIPAGFTHAALVRAGGILEAGPLSEVVADEPMSRCFGTALRIGGAGDRWTADVG